MPLNPCWTTGKTLYRWNFVRSFDFNKMTLRETLYPHIHCLNFEIKIYFVRISSLNFDFETVSLIRLLANKAK